ncbi:MAG TPA: hypothetical protein VL201_05800 [Patescibacteria group bacterium]|jgi:hypothetical protein|nr:hypothetical protein [Patescibacteria group bacterium]
MLKGYALCLILFLFNNVEIYTQLTVQCRDGDYSLSQEMIKMLPGLNIGNDLIKRPKFPRYHEKGDQYVEFDWVPTMTYMQELITIASSDTKTIKKQFSSKTLNEWWCLYVDCDYLNIKKEENFLFVQYSLLVRFYSEIRATKEHWAFVANYFDIPNTISEREKAAWYDLRVNIDGYWASKLRSYEEKWIFYDNEKGEDCFIYIGEKLFNVLKTRREDLGNRGLKNEMLFFNEFFFKEGVLDLSNLGLTDGMLYLEYDKYFCERTNYFKLDLNYRFLDYFLQIRGGINFAVKKIILDNNKITTFLPCLFIKHFANLQEISIKGCSINEYFSENDFIAFTVTRSDYLTKTLKPKCMVECIRGDPKTLMWNGFSCLSHEPDDPSEGPYDYENNTRPLKIIVDDVQKFFPCYYTDSYSLREIIKTVGTDIKKFSIIMLSMIALSVLLILSGDRIKAIIDQLSFNGKMFILFNTVFFNYVFLYKSLDTRIRYKKIFPMDKLVIESASDNENYL